MVDSAISRTHFREIYIMKPVMEIAAVACVCMFVTMSADTAAASDSPVAGNWMSKPGQFKIVFRVSQDGDGSFDALTDIPDQEAWGMPADLVVSGGGAVSFDIYNIRCRYEGTISKNGKTIEGKFKGPDGGGMPLVLERIDNPPARKSKRPQEPKEPYPYKTEEVFFDNTIDHLRLAGTLTLPQADGPFPAVLLVTGSGPNDRDQLIWGHRTFLVLADYLTRKGIAVLRYDDRGVGRSTGDYDTAVFEDFKRDALAGLAYLKTRPEIDTDKVGLLGHSEGGAIGTLAASSSADAAYLVLMAAPGLSDFDGLLKQFADSYRVNGASEEAISVKCSILKRIFNTIRHETDSNIATSKIKDILQKARPRLAALSEDQREKIEFESVDTFEFGWMFSPGFSSILRYDPREPLMKVKCPVLAMNGGNDVQMPVENLAAIEAALEAAGNHKCTIKEMPGLNHLFQTSQTGSPSEYAGIEETLSPAALDIISDWILRHSRER